VFSSSPVSNGPASRVLGPYDMVRFAALGLWGWTNDGTEPIRIATRTKESLSWELDGFDDPLWGDVEVISPNPKTSGNGKLSFLAAWGSVLAQGGTEAEAQTFVAELFKHVPVLDSGARGATSTFAQKGIGDVHLTWENEAYYEVAEAKGELEIIAPPASIRAEPRVAVVDANVDRKGTRIAAENYLQFLYTDVGQEIIAKHHYRPTSPGILAKHLGDFSKTELFTIDRVAKDWADAGQKFFAEGGVFDAIYAPVKK